MNNEHVRGTKRTHSIGNESLHSDQRHTFMFNMKVEKSKFSIEKSCNG